MQHNPHDHGNDDECDEGVGNAVKPSGGQEFEVWEILAESKARRPVGRIEARCPAIDQEAAEGNDEGLQVEPGDQPAVDGTYDRAEHENERQRQHP